MLRLVIQRPIAVSMLFLSLVFIGVLSFQRLPVDLLPSITYPRLTVITTYEDIPARDIERLITEPIEEVVTALSGVRRVISHTREGVSIITIEYEWGRQMDFANLHLREAVDKVAFREDFPEDAERPVILRWDPLSRPISILTLSGTGEIKALTEFAEEVVKPALQQVDGLSQAEVVGGEQREIVVEPDPKKMAVYQITIEDISQALSRNNITFPGGKVRKGPLHLSLRITGEYQSIEDIEATEISRSGDSPLRISDIARVMDYVKESDGATLLGDEPVVSLFLYKEPEANTIQVSRGVAKSLEILKKDYKDFDYDFVYRDSDYVRASFNGLVQSLIIGALLAFMVLFFFLRDIRSPIVVGISIPVSILITFALLYFGKVKLNLMSLGGLSLAAGMLVDNAIIVLENINRHIDERASEFRALKASDPGNSLARRRILASASEIGTREVSRAVLAATLTTIAVFFPVVYVPGIAGAFFRDQALTVTFSLLISISTALLLQPMMSARVLTYRDAKPGGLFSIFNSMLSRAYTAYHTALLKSLKKPKRMLLFLLAALAITALLSPRIDRALMPERTSGDFKLDIELPNGTPLEETASSVRNLAKWIEEDENVKCVFSEVGHTERTVSSLKEYTGPNTARMRIILEPGRGAHKKSLLIQKKISSYLAKAPQINYVFKEEGIGLKELLGAEGGAFTVGIISKNPLEGIATAEKLVERLKHREGFLNPHSDRMMGTPNLVVKLNMGEIMRSGLSPELVARELKNLISGIEATTFNEVDQRIDIAVRIARPERRDLYRSLNSSIKLPGGKSIPLRSLVILTEEKPVRELIRRNQRPMVKIVSDLEGISSDDAWKTLKQEFSMLAPPPGLRIVRGEEYEEMLKSFDDLKWAMLLAVFLVYILLAAQFESFLDPLLIASIVPVGLAGSILTIALTGQSINLLSIIGMVALIGIAVNDAIIKIDTIRRLREGGTPGYQAILEASRLRFRPILMTSATTILAMVPMAIGMGSGEQLQRPLALTIMGGLFFTTSLTLIYTPIIYMLAHRIRKP